MFKQFALKAASLLVFAGAMSACGQNTQIVKNVSVDTYTQEGDQYGQLAVTMSTGQTSIIATDFPVPNPQNPSEIIGHISVKNSLGGGSTEIGLALNLNKLLKAPGMNDPYLPNGTIVPIAGLDPSTLKTYKFGNFSKLYTAVDTRTNTATIGMALSIKNFKVGVSTNLFYPFNVADYGVGGMVGIFTGPQELQSGIALFADASAWLASSKSDKDAISSVRFIAPETSKQDRKTIENLLWEMHSGRQTIELN